MNIHDLLQAAETDGMMIKVSETGGLTYSGDRATTEKWLPVLRERRTEILTHLICDPQPAFDLELLYEQFTERAAIHEFDGNLDREAAERMTLAHVLQTTYQFNRKAAS